MCFISEKRILFGNLGHISCKIFLLFFIGLEKYKKYKKPRWQGETIRGPITEVKQPWAQSILGWVTIQDTVLAAKDVIVTCRVPLWLMSYEHTRGSQSAP